MAPSQARCSSHELARPSLPAHSCLRRRGPRVASLFSEARALCLNVALALLKLKSRRSPATRLLSARGGRGFHEATEGVALQRRLCSGARARGGAAGERARQRYHTRGDGACYGWAGLTTLVGTTGPSNKGMKQTKPSILELRSLSPVLDGPAEASRNGRARSALRRTNSRCPTTASLEVMRLRPDGVAHERRG